MKYLAITLLFLSSNLFAECIDFSGRYKRSHKNCDESLSKDQLRSLPIIPFSIGDKNDRYIGKGEEFEIVQKGCEKIDFVYTNSDPTYVPQFQKVTKSVSFAQGKVEVSKTGFTYKYTDTGTDCYFFCLTGKTKRVLSLTNLSDNKVQVYAKSSFFGSTLIIVPQIWSSKATCEIEKLD